MNKYLDAMAKPFMPITPWLLRIGLGVAFIYHGYDKFPIPGDVIWWESKGFVHAELVRSLVALGEVGAGAGILLGGILPGNIGNLTTRFSGGAVVVIMIGAFYLAHMDWFADLKKLFTSEQIFLFIIGLYFTIRGNN
tara:strand:+ start:447 stop:857 length:411 start_codon:yes stop_codon:yes gene_type:complete